MRGVWLVVVFCAVALCVAADAAATTDDDVPTRKAPSMVNVDELVQVATQKLAWLREGFMFAVMHSFEGVVEFASDLLGVSHEAAFYSLAGGTMGALFLFFTAISDSSSPKGGKSTQPGELRVSALTLYPIKSCRGINVSSAKIGAYGFVNDRRWMIVDAATGRFLSQRQLPKLALVQPVLGDKEMHVTAPGMLNTLKIPYTGTRHTGTRDVSVWEHNGTGLDEGRKAAKWFSTYLGQEVALVRQNAKRDVDKRYAPKGGSNEVSFADGFPYLLIGEKSVSALNERSGSFMTMNRFRPNIVVDRSKAYAEDNWKELRVGDVRLFGVKRCDRCKLTTVDPVTGEFDVKGEPLASLRKYRTGGTATGNKGEPGKPNKVWMGLNLVADKAATGRVVRVGDTVTVVKRG